MTEIIDYNIDSADNSEISGEEESVFIVDGENENEKQKNEEKKENEIPPELPKPRVVKKVSSLTEKQVKSTNNNSPVPVEQSKSTIITKQKDASQLKKPGERKKVEKKTKEDILKDINDEITSLYEEVQTGREKCIEMNKWLPVLKTYQEAAQAQYHLSREFAFTLNTGLIIRDKEPRSDFQEGISFITNAFQINMMDTFAQVDLFYKVVESTKDIIEETKDYSKTRQNYDKLKKEYEKCVQNFDSLSKNAKTQVNKLNQAKEKKEDIYAKLVDEGEHVIKVYTNIYTKLVTSIFSKMVDLNNRIHDSVHEVYSLYTPDINEKMKKWRDNVMKKSFGNEQLVIPKWMEENEQFKVIVTQEHKYLELLNIIVIKFAKSLLNSPSMVTSGLSASDINDIFTNIESMRRSQMRLVQELIGSTKDTFVNVYAAHMANIKSNYTQYCKTYPEAIILFNNAMNITEFKEIIENVETNFSNGHKILDLFRAPFEHVPTCTNHFKMLKNTCSDMSEKIEVILYVFKELKKEIDVAERMLVTKQNMNKISDWNVKHFPRYRQYYETYNVTINKVTGQIFCFTDVFVFTKLDKKRIVYDKEYTFKSINTITSEPKNKQVIIKFNKVKGQVENIPDLVIGCKDKDTTEQLLNKMKWIKDDWSDKKIFGVDISTSPITRDEQSYVMPKILHQMLDYLEVEAPKQEGIIRIAVSMVELDEGIMDIDSGEEIDISKWNAHIVMNLIKRYCNLLPNKLPLELQVIPLEDTQKANESIQAILNKLPKPYLAFITRLFKVLYLIHINAKENLMDAENIAKLIAPNVYPDDEKAMFELEKLTRTIRYMIQNYDETFGEIITNINKLFKEGEEKRKKENMVERVLVAGFVEPTVKVIDAWGMDDEDDSMALTLKDIVKQGDVEMLDSNAYRKRWVLLKRNCLMIFKTQTDKTPFITMNMKDSSFETDSNDKNVLIFSSGSRKVIFKFIDGQRDIWVKTLGELL